MTENRFEILAPAGSLQILKTAIANGADAVYIGGTSFSARKNAHNFTNDEIIEGIRYAHIYGKKVYVAVNILINDFELNEVFDYIAFLYNCGTDALIIQDLGLLYIIKKYFPDFEVHASTQMTIHNLAGAETAKNLGFSRVVLSRELSFDEIAHIHSKCDIELEVFVHGALCMSYSGQCLMSSFLGCRSGNRGACAQPCRLPYTLLDSKCKPVSYSVKYPMSLKDLCLIDDMEKLYKCSAASLKIEGRMKGAEYVALVTAMYDKYRNGGLVSSEDMRRLTKIFSRSGFTKGYFEGCTGRNMLNYDKSNDNVYKNIDSDVAQYAKVLTEKKPKKIKISADVRLEYGKPIHIKVKSGDYICEAVGAVCSEKAVNKPLTAERAAEQMNKTGNTPFTIEKTSINIDDGITIPIKEFNDVRRTALAMLETKLCEVNRKASETDFEFDKQKGDIRKILYKAEVRNTEQALGALRCGFDKVIVPYELYDKNRAFFDKYPKKISVLLPIIERKNTVHNIGADEIYVSNLSQFAEFQGRNIIANYSLNVFNSLSMRVLKQLGAAGVCVSPELNLHQIRKVDSYLPKEYIVYGRIPLMTVQNCIVKSVNGKCACTGEMYYLKDRKAEEFPLFTNKGECTNTIYNSKPVYMADKLDEIPADGAFGYRFIFTTETDKQVKEIFDAYKNKRKSAADFTRGHYYRGV